MSDYHGMIEWERNGYQGPFAAAKERAAARNSIENEIPDPLLIMLNNMLNHYEESYTNQSYGSDAALVLVDVIRDIESILAFAEGVA